MASSLLRMLAICIALGANAALFAAGGCEGCRPFDLEAQYTDETWKVPQGGRARGGAHLEKLDVALAIDGGRAFNLPGLALFAHAIYDGTDSVSALAGDAQGISNIEAVAALRLLELWSEWSYRARHSLRVGLYDVNSEFDVNETGALFINASHGIGKDFSQSGQAGPSIFPVTSLGARVQWTPVAGWTVRLVALDGVPGDPDRPKRTTVRLGEGDGALLVTEVERRGDRLSKLALGSWYYTGTFERLAEAQPDGVAPRKRGTHGAYVLSELRLSTPTPRADEALAASERGLKAFLRLGAADAQVNRFGRYAGAGFVYTGVLAADDQLGFAVGRAMNGGAYRQVQMLAGAPPRRAETNLELTWRFAVGDWLAIQPDVQYVLDPDTDADIGNVLALGLRFEVSAAF